MAIIETYLVTIKYEAEKEVLTEKTIEEFIISNMESLEYTEEIYECLSATVSLIFKGGKRK